MREGELRPVARRPFWSCRSHLGFNLKMSVGMERRKHLGLGDQSEVGLRKGEHQGWLSHSWLKWQGTIVCDIAGLGIRWWVPIMIIWGAHGTILHFLVLSEPGCLLRNQFPQSRECCLLSHLMDLRADRLSIFSLFPIAAFQPFLLLFLPLTLALLRLKPFSCTIIPFTAIICGPLTLGSLHPTWCFFILPECLSLGT